MFSKSKFAIVISSILIMLTFCKNNKEGDVEIEEPTPIDLSEIKLIKAFPKLSFERPLDLQVPPGNSNRIFIVEQQGIIWSFNNDSLVSSKTLFLDIRSMVDDSANEEGLLGLAFHPKFNTNGYFFVNYTTPNKTTVIVRFQASSNDMSQVDLSTKLTVLEFEQPYSNHNGGQLAFGPDDGYLYIAVGDGGAGGDPQGNSQNLTNLLGTILRIDVDSFSDGNNYTIPPGNPYANHSTYKKEIYAYGLRNPWRMSFDTQNGTLWAADVGQNKYEEIDLIEKGGNYGWNIMEGFHCYNSNNCDDTDLIMPIAEYDHNDGDVSITGGYVYRGDLIKPLQGWYVYADFASGKIWALNTKDHSTKLLFDTDINISSFGTDNQNELYFCGFNGNIYKFSN